MNHLLSIDDLDRAELDALLDLAVAGAAQLTAVQTAALAGAPSDGSATRATR